MRLKNSSRLRAWSLFLFFFFVFYFILLHFYFLFFFKQPIVVVCFAFIVFALVLEAAAAPEAAQQQQQEISLSSSSSSSSPSLSSVVRSIVFFTHTRRAQVRLCVLCSVRTWVSVPVLCCALSSLLWLCSLRYPVSGGRISAQITCLSLSLCSGVSELV